MTVRDVCEATDASPTLIARLLDDMRGTDDLKTIQAWVGEHEERLDVVEHRLDSLPKIRTIEPQPTYLDPIRLSVKTQTFESQNVARDGKRVVTAIIIMFALIAFVATMNDSLSGGHGQVRSTLQIGDKTYREYEDGSMVRVENGREYADENPMARLIIDGQHKAR
ncbi:MAG: hypothetical protein JST12_08220 [Armatimonadetes bacterium]|nr:hypothetical protein [Armatimonadota bacterium]